MKTNTSITRAKRLLENRAELLAMTDNPKEYLWEISCDGYEDAGAPKGTMCMLHHRPAKYGHDIILILIHNDHCNKWAFGYLLRYDGEDYLFEPERRRMIRLLEGTYTLCGVIAPLVEYKFQPVAHDNTFRQITKPLTPFVAATAVESSVLSLPATEMPQ